MLFLEVGTELSCELSRLRFSMDRYIDSHALSNFAAVSPFNRFFNAAGTRRRGRVGAAPTAAEARAERSKRADCSGSSFCCALHASSSFSISPVHSWPLVV